jgi:pimeloyl-ACP methyl ester carboxylesterase
MDALALDRAALVGCSFGGAVALVTAVTARDRVSALVLASAPAPDITPSNRLRAAWDAEETALERGDLDGAVEAVLDAWLAGRDDMPDFVTSARRLSEALPRGSYRQIDNARHLIPLEAPETFRAALIDFLIASA